MLYIFHNNNWTAYKEPHCTKRKLRKYLKMKVTKILWGFGSFRSKDRYVCVVSHIESTLFGPMEKETVYITVSKRHVEFFLSHTGKGI